MTPTPPDTPERDTTMRDLLPSKVRRVIYAVLALVVPVWSVWTAVEIPPDWARLTGALVTAGLTGAGFGLAHSKVDD